MIGYDDPGGCLVCGQTIGRGRPDPLRCHDCVENHYMIQTGTLAEAVWLTDDGPVRLTPTELAAAKAQRVRDAQPMTPDEVMADYQNRSQ